MRVEGCGGGGGEQPTVCLRPYDMKDEPVVSQGW